MAEAVYTSALPSKSTATQMAPVGSHDTDCRELNVVLASMSPNGVQVTPWNPMPANPLLSTTMHWVFDARHDTP